MVYRSPLKCGILDNTHVHDTALCLIIHTTITVYVSAKLRIDNIHVSLMHLQISGSNILDGVGDAPIHYLVKGRGGEDPADTKNLLLKLLTYTDADIDLKDGNGRTALHTAAEVSREHNTII